MKNTINWFEIPSVDFDRAVRFYNTVFNVQLHTEFVMDVKSGIFPDGGEGSVNGAVVFSSNYEPSAKGSVVYLNANNQLKTILERIEPTGGKVLMPPTDIGFGFIAFFLDTEGNRIGLHSET